MTKTITKRTISRLGAIAAMAVVAAIALPSEPVKQSSDKAPKQERKRETTAQQRKLTKEQYAMLVKRVQIAIEEGLISKEDGKKRLAAARKFVVQNSDRRVTDRAVVTDRAPMRVRLQSDRAQNRMSEKDIVKIGTEIRRLVAEGKVSAENGRIVMEILMGGGRNAETDIVSRRVHLAGDENVFVVRGADAGMRVGRNVEVRRAGGDENVFVIRGEGKDVNWVRAGETQRAISREEIAKVGAELRKLVAAGTITEADAKKRMDRLMSIGTQRGVTDRRNNVIVDRRAAATDVSRVRIERASGTQTRNVAATRLRQADRALRTTDIARVRQVATDREVATRTMRTQISREQMGQIMVELRKAVEAGQMSGEDARKIAGELRKQMGGSKAKAKSKTNKAMNWKEFSKSLIK